MALTQRTVRKMIEPVRRRLRLLFSRGIVVAVRDGEGFQILQVKGLPGEVLDGIERIQNYGFTSRPLPGAEAFLAFVGGARSHGVAVGVDDRRHRKRDLEPGESAQYSDEGDSIHLKRGKIIAITSGGEIDVDAPTVKLRGDTEVDIEGATVKLTGTGTVEISGAIVTIDATGELTITGTSVSIGPVTTVDGKPFLAHAHSGVEAGSSNTGGVV